MADYKYCDVIIPKVFTCGRYEVHLKEEIVGSIFKIDDRFYYLADDNNIMMRINNEEKRNPDILIRELQYRIYKLYNDIQQSKNITEELDLYLSGLIDKVIDNSVMLPKVLLIGYEFDYPKTIIQSLRNCGYQCKAILLKKNVELYDPGYSNIDNDFSTVFDKVKEKVNAMSEKYDRCIIDIPNLSLYTTYENTKSLLEYLESKTKNMLIMTTDTGTKFTRIFGDKYSNSTIDSKYVIRCGRDTTTKNKVKSILL